MKKALEGVTILDFSQLLAGPFATMMLGDMGAKVIKIERVGSGDIYRGMTFFNKYLEGGESPMYMAWNRSKRSLAIDMKDPKAKEILYKIAESADVVVENFRPGVMDRLGYGYEDFKKINPRIVYASNSGYGSDGPYVTRPGQDMLIQCLTGLTTLTGRRDDPPTALGTGLPDMLSAFHLVYGILSGLLYCAKTGKGQRVEVDLMRSTLALESQEFMTLLNIPVQYERPASGIAHPFQQAPFGIYQCSDGYLAIAMVPFDKLVKALNAPDLMRYNDEQMRYDKRDEIFNAIENVTKTATVEHWLEVMLALDLWVAAVQDITDVENDPQVRHMRALSGFNHKKAGELRCVAPAVTMSETPATINYPPPMIGEHSREILAEYGVDAAVIQKLIDDGVVSEEI